MFMELRNAARLLFKPGTLSEDELKKAGKHLKKFCHGYYTPVFAGKVERLWLCRSTIVALSDRTTNLRSCGLAWSFWQFPAERLERTLTNLIRFRRFPHAALTNAISVADLDPRGGKSAPHGVVRQRV